MRRVLPLALLAAAGCNSDRTTWSDVGPIYEEHCVTCHTDGGAGPFVLDSYESAAMWADAAVNATATRQMPPFQVRGDGTCGEYQDNHWLSDGELATIAAWAAEGAKEGGGYEVSLPEGRKLEGEAITDTATAADFVPVPVGSEYAEFDEYRCFLVDLDEAEDVFLKGYEVIPGNPAIVHHVVGMTVNLSDRGWSGTKTNQELIDELSAEDERAGWPCLNGAGDGVSYEAEVVAWAPGQGAVNYPHDTGLRLSTDQVLVYQTHYNLVDPSTHGQPDQTTVRLSLADSVDREAYFFLPDLFLAGEASVDALPPGEEETSVTFDLPIRWLTGDLPLTFEILAVLPHMHERGRKMSIELERGDGSEDTCVADVQNWDFNWQQIYMYEEPIQFTSDDTLKVECIYDTSDDTTEILPGWGTQNEMCLPALLGTVAQ